MTTRPTLMWGGRPAPLGALTKYQLDGPASGSLNSEIKVSSPTKLVIHSLTRRADMVTDSDNAIVPFAWRTPQLILNDKYDQHSLPT